MNYLLGIDAGTTSFKALLIDDAGNEIASAVTIYKLITPAPSIVEFDAEEYWDIFRKIVSEVIVKAKAKPSDIKALAISSQAETLICVDRNGRPLRKAIVWLDNRSEAEAGMIRQTFGTDIVFGITGQPEIAATWPATKILWLSRNERETFKKVYKYLLLEDYLIYRLTGRFCTERSLLSSTIYMNVHTGGWWNEMLDYIGVSSDMLPTAMESGEQAGYLSDEAAAQTGLCRDTIVVTGAIDQLAGMIGAGNINDDMITETTGAAMAVCANINKTENLKMVSGIPYQYHALKGKYCLMLWSQTAGMVLKWFKEAFYDAGTASDKSIDVYKMMDSDASRVPAGSEGLLLLPHLSGAACPEFNPAAKGVFYGITLKHTRAHFTRAILEAVAYMLLRNIRLIEECGINVNEVRLLGGGARSPLWNSIKADVIGKPVVTVKNTETACLGAAILAGVGSGIFKSIDEGCIKTVKVRESIVPDMINNEIYKRSFDNYLKLYGSLEKVFDIM